MDKGDKNMSRITIKFDDKQQNQITQKIRENIKSDIELIYHLDDTFQVEFLNPLGYSEMRWLENFEESVMSENMELSKEVIKKLQDAGYSIDLSMNSDSIVASKEYKSSIGNRDSLIYLSKGDGFNKTISCTFFSEKENKYALLIPINASTKEIHQIMDEFIIGSEKMIQDAFCMRLSDISSEYDISTHGEMNSLISRPNCALEVK